MSDEIDLLQCDKLRARLNKVKEAQFETSFRVLDQLCEDAIVEHEKIAPLKSIRTQLEKYN